MTLEEIVKDCREAQDNQLLTACPRQGCTGGLKSRQVKMVKSPLLHGEEIRMVQIRCTVCGNDWCARAG